MQSYYHFIVTTLPGPSLKELTELVRDELAEGNFGPHERVKAVWSRPAVIENFGENERGFKVLVRGPDRDIKLIRANLRAEYGQLSPPIEDWPEDGR